MERQPYPPPGSCVAKNSQRPASVEAVRGGVPPYRVKETLVVSGGGKRESWDHANKTLQEMSVEDSEKPGFQPE